VGGLRSDELKKGIMAILGSRTRDHESIQSKACCEIYGFPPRSRLLIQEKCNLTNWQEQRTLENIKPEQLPVNWYHTRLCLILLQFQILDSACLYDFNTAK
jgi:hypothetical protein